MPPVTSIVGFAILGGAQKNWKRLGRLHSRGDICSEFSDWCSQNEKREKDIQGRRIVCTKRWHVEMGN